MTSCVTGLLLTAITCMSVVVRGETLPPWSPGGLDIHQIATGRGNAALVIGPDGTSLLIDAGAITGNTPWRDIETPASRAAGPVEIAVAGHHGYFDAVGAASVRALQPLVWVVPAWHITHLNIGVLERMLSDRLYPGPREVLVTDLLPATALINQRFMPKVKSTSGHIVIRVAPGGNEFRVFITGNRDETDTVKAVFGPFVCR